MTFTIDLELETFDYAAALAEKVDWDASLNGDLSAGEIAALCAGVERGLQAEAEGRYRPAADVFADLEARYGLPAS